MYLHTVIMFKDAGIMASGFHAYFFMAQLPSRA